MNQLVLFQHTALGLIAASAQLRIFGIFHGQYLQPQYTPAYAYSAREFLAWCEVERVPSIVVVQPIRSAPTAKARLATLRHLFDWMVIGQIMPTNPAFSVRGPIQRDTAQLGVYDLRQNY